MPPKKGGKKGGKKGKKGKKKGEAGPPIVTTRDILKRREKMQCPGLGDAFTKTMEVESILEDVTAKLIMKTISKKGTSLALSGMKLSQMPSCLRVMSASEKLRQQIRMQQQHNMGGTASSRFEFQRHQQSQHVPGEVNLPMTLGMNLCNLLGATLTEVTLAKNNLFNPEEVMGALGRLPLLTHIDLSCNYLNGILLPDDLPEGAFGLLQVLKFDSNNITAFAAPLNLQQQGAAAGGGAHLHVQSATDALGYETIGSGGGDAGFGSGGAQGSAFVGRIGGCSEERLDPDGSSTAIGEGRKERICTRPPGNWTRLRILSAANNAITSIPAEAVHWTSVNVLILRNNKIKTLPPQLLRSWGTARESVGEGDGAAVSNDLSSSAAAAAEAGPETDGQAPTTSAAEPAPPPPAAGLTRLLLGSNSLTSLPEEIGCCVLLQELDLSYNTLTMLPRSLSCCTDLEVLQVGSNSIADIHPDIFCGCTGLRELMLYRNKISALPPEIGNLQVLERLSLASNNLHTLPAEVGACGNLREMYLNNNAKFSSFPSTAGHLRNLQELAMRKCPALKQLPNSTGDMTGLRELDVRAAKKQVCKIAPEVAESLQKQHCTLRGGVVKKAKGGKKAKPGTA